MSAAFDTQAGVIGFIVPKGDDMGSISVEIADGYYVINRYLNISSLSSGDEIKLSTRVYNDETHDFYIASNAVEVKTTGTQAPYFAQISSEYQLDNSDVPGKLFLRFYAFRKSQSTGEKLPEIIARIRQPGMPIKTTQLAAALVIR